MEIYAHRGSSLKYPENSIAAFSAAIEEGATGIETDLRLTRDEVIVLVHDSDLRRVTGDRRLVADLTWDDVRSTRTARGHPIARLEDLWALADGRIRLNLEIKDPRVTPRLVRFLEAHRGDVLVTSFHLAEVHAVRRALPEIPVGPVLNRLASGEMTRVAGRGYHAISLAARSFTAAALEFCRREGARLLLWVVNRPERVLDFAELGVDGVFTDRPGVVAEALRAGRL